MWLASGQNGFCRKRVIVAFWAAVGKVALKMLQFLVGDKKGRKFLGYVIGIALFIVLLPVIAIYGLFGWMSGGEVAEIVGYDAIYQNLPTEIREQIDENEIQLDAIETVFRENGLASGDISKAKLIYLSYLTDRFSEGNFYQRLADCFLTVSEEGRLLFKIAVELSMLANIIAGERKFPPHQIADLRAECINEVKRLNGMLTFEEAVEWQNSYSR